MKKKTTYDIHERILNRLTRRQELARVARVVASSGNSHIHQFFQEKDEGGFCFSNTQQAGNKNHFVCGAYSCPVGATPPYGCPGDVGFECDTDRRTFNCGKDPKEDAFNCEAGDFQCNQTQTTNTFSCEQGEKAADYFDCRTFVCGVEGENKGDFNCDSVVDFSCGGKKENPYVCMNDFTCSAGHLFLCGNGHACDDKFTCSGGTVEGCTEGSPPVVQAVSCAAGPNVNDYTPRGCVLNNGQQVAVSCTGEQVSCTSPGGNDYGVRVGTGGDENIAPGDFLCGHSGKEIDVFDCRKNFDCKAKSDFSCIDTTEFTCAQQGGGNNDFDCHSASPFECYSRFTCASAALFDCSEKEDVEYKCKFSYAECGSNKKKECKTNYYSCISNHACEPYEEHGCTNPTDFKCDSFSSLVPQYNCLASGTYSAEW